MTVVCPACRAGNQQGPTCRRCRADLSLLFAVESERAARLAAARQSAAQGRLDAAFMEVRQAEALRRGADAARISAAVALLRRDFAAAWREYQRARSLTGG